MLNMRTTGRRDGSPRRTSFLTAAIGLGLLAITQPAVAHPHVWVEIDSEILVEAQRITGVRHRWVFDEAYSEQAVEGLDVNNDGRIDRQELAELAKINMEALPQFGYFTEVQTSGQRAAVKPPTDYWLEQIDLPPAKDDAAKRPRKALVLHFTLALEQAVDLSAKDLRFSVRDTSFFIAFLTTDKSAVRFAKDSAGTCRLAADEEAKSLTNLAQSMQDAIAKAGEEPSATAPTDGPAFNQVFTVTCP